MTLYTALYDLLGVPVKATAAEIIKAFRTKAKKAHPDVGGSADEFRKIQQAYSVLSDPKRRAQYDKNGFAGDEPPDTQLAQIYETVGEAIGTCLNEHARMGIDCECFDVLKATTAIFEKRIAERQAKINQISSTVDKYIKVAKRTKKRGGKNVLRMIFEGRAATGKKMVDDLNGHNKMDQRAIDMLLSHDYEFDQPVETHLFQGVRIT